MQKRDLPRRAAALAVVSAMLLSAGCSGGTQTPPEQLLAARAAGSGLRIFDVRTTREYAAGHVPGALHIPYHQVWLRRAELPSDKAEPIVVYCSHGPRAGMAAFQLWTLGYQNISYLAGQMSSWQRQGLPLETGREP